MKFLDKISKRFAKTASATIKKEATNAILDLIPTVAGAITMGLAITAFHEHASKSVEKNTPYCGYSTVTTNNYFFRDLSDESIKRLLEGRR